MKRRILAILAIFMMCTVTAAASTSSFRLELDKEMSDTDEAIYVTVRLTDAMKGSFRNVQGQLKYDAATVSYVSHQLGEAYSHYAASDMREKGWFSFSYTEFAEAGFSDLPEGMVTTVVFKLENELMETADFADFVLEIDVQDTAGISEKMSDVLRIDIQKKPYTEIMDQSEETVLNDTGQTQHGEKEVYDMTNDDSSVSEKSHNTQGEMQEERVKSKRTVLPIGIGGIGLLTYVIYRVWKRKKEQTE